MTEQHPITPPPELVKEWIGEVYGVACVIPGPASTVIADRAAQWGADQELEACCEWIHNESSDNGFIANLRAARRPKPPSLKKQALAVMSKESWSIEEEEIIRRALEQLPDDTTP